MLSPTTQFGYKHFASVALSLVAFALSPFAFATTIKMQTTLGAIEIDLYDATAPRTVANFLAYANSGAYRESFIHRSVPGFVIQGGGYTWEMPQNTINAIPANTPLANEFSSTRPNVRGSIAMAKLGNDPNSATSQWFINLANNTDLNTQNGGFTVFGQVRASSMAVVDAIAALPLANAGSPFDSLPLASTPTGLVQKTNVVVVSTVTNISAPYQGLWWNAGESGWGMTLTQHGTIVFAALYTYDAAGLPVWYVLPNCPLVTGNRCTGDLYGVSGGVPPTVAWVTTGRTVSPVGTGTLQFADDNNATFSYALNGVTSTRAITRQVFAAGTAPPAIDYTDLWWNANESGWGISLVQQFGTLFAAWYVYDGNGKAIWYVAPNCPIASTNTCTSDLARVDGGIPLTSAWNATKPVVTKVGDITFTFPNANSALMRYTLNGIVTSRTITRQEF